MGEGGHLHSCGSLSEPCSGSTTSAGSGGASVGGVPLVPRHAAAGRWPYGAVGWTVGLVGLSVWETRNVQVCAVRSTALCVGTCGPVLCDPLLCVAIAKVLHGAASVGDASPWILARSFLGRLLEMGEGGHLHSCGSLSEPCSGSNLGGIRGGVCGWRAFGA